MLEQYRETLQERVKDIPELDILIKFLTEKIQDSEDFRKNFASIDAILGREANPLERLIHQLFTFQVMTTDWVQNFYIKVSGSDMQTHKLNTQFLSQFLSSAFADLVPKVVEVVQEDF